MVLKSFFSLGGNSKEPPPAAIQRSELDEATAALNAEVEKLRQVTEKCSLARLLREEHGREAASRRNGK